MLATADGGANERAVVLVEGDLESVERVNIRRVRNDRLSRSLRPTVEWLRGPNDVLARRVTGDARAGCAATPSACVLLNASWAACLLDACRVKPCAGPGVMAASRTTSLVSRRERKGNRHVAGLELVVFGSGRTTRVEQPESRCGSWRAWRHRGWPPLPDADGGGVDDGWDPCCFGGEATSRCRWRFGI